MNITIESYRVLFEEDGKTTGYGGMELRSVGTAQIPQNERTRRDTVFWELVLEFTNGTTRKIDLRSIENQPGWKGGEDGAKAAAAAVGTIVQAAPPNGAAPTRDFTTNPGWETIPDALGPGVTGYIPIMNAVL